MSEKNFAKKSRLRREQRREELRVQIRDHRAVFIIYLVLRVLVTIVLVAQVFNRNLENAFLCLLTLVLFSLPSIVEKQLKIELPDTLQVVILLFIFASEILGEISAYFVTVPFWDTILHTLNGFLMAAIGFSLVDIFNRSERFSVKLSPFYIAAVAFCFSMTIGVLWEFFEFGMDIFFKTDMQKDTVIHTISSVLLDPDRANNAVIISGIRSVAVNGEELAVDGYIDIGLIDTMQDLFVNFIGAAVFSVIGICAVKGRRSESFVRKFVPRVEMKGAEAAEDETNDKAAEKPCESHAVANRRGQ